MGPESLDQTLARLAGSSVPGVEAAVVTDDGETSFAGAGVRDVSAGAPVGPDTAFLWFSMTKIVTATAAMQLVEDGSLDLDDPVTDHLPQFPAPRDGWPVVRVRHLLSHSSGMANPIPVRWVHPAGERGRDPHEFAIQLLAKNGRLRSEAGAKAVYSNLGYIALGEVIAAAAGIPYEEFVRTRILEPLGMTRTGFSYEGLGDDAAVGYQRRLHPMTPLFRLILPRGIVAGPQGRWLAFNRFLVDGAAYGGLVGSARDAARFMGAHLGDGQLGEVRILSVEGVRAMQTIQATGPKIDVGYGWFRRGADRAGSDFVEHLGGGGGFWNMMRIHPDRGVGILSMGNATAYDHGAVAAAALRRP